MGRSKPKEIGAIVVKDKKRNLAGLAKILVVKVGSKDERAVTFSAILEVEENGKYHQASFVMPLTGYPIDENEFKRDNEIFTRKVMSYLKRRGFSLYY